MKDALDLLADALADRVAARVVERLATSSPPAWVHVASPPADLAVSPGELRAAIKRGELTPAQSGRRLLLERAAIEAWLSSRKRSTRPPIERPSNVDPVELALAAAGLRVVEGGRK